MVVKPGVINSSGPASLWERRDTLRGARRETWNSGKHFGKDMEVSPEFWNGKKVFVTGHTGFKGSWIALWLQKLGADVIGYSLPPPTEPSLFRLARVSGRMRSVEGDIRDSQRLRATVAAHRPDIVIHMAALPLVLPSYADPAATFSTNTMGTVNVLEAVRHCDSVRVLVNVTSDKCYQNHDQNQSFRETDPMGGLDPYSASKGCAELVTAAYRHSFFGNAASAPAKRVAAVATVRAGNVVGGGDWSPYRVVPDVMRALLQRRPITIRRPGAIRPWQHVLEPLCGYLLLAERLWEDDVAYAEAWNFGPPEDDAWPVSRLVDELGRLWGENVPRRRDAYSHPAEAAFLRLDCSKAKARLGWAPALRLATALEWIVDWYQAYRAGDDMRPVTEAQIEHHQELGKIRRVKIAASVRTADTHRARHEPTAGV